MAIEIQNMPFAAAIATTPRSLVIAGFAAGMIALAAAPAARADSATVAQRASLPPVDRSVVHTSVAEISREYLIKAAILYNLAKFATWPETAFANPGAPLRVCVLGDDPFGAALDTLHGKQVGNRPLATARIAAVHDAPQCHILFVSVSETARLAKILDYVGQMPILTVADINRFANSGGIIALKKVDNRSRIEINTGAANQAGLKLSSKLLRLADKTATFTKSSDATGSPDASIGTRSSATVIGTDTATLVVDADMSVNADIPM